MIEGIEIEAPYRYRAYFIGRKPIYDIQNNRFIAPDYPEVTSINEVIHGPHVEYVVSFDNGSSLHIKIETPGTIIHYD